MICRKINKDFLACDYSYAFRWVQRAVLINKSDVNAFFTDGHNITFGLNPDTRGFSFESIDRTVQVLGNYETVTRNNYKQYRHNVQIVISGLDFDTEGINNGEYFAALMTSTGRVYIFGFEYTLKAEDYLFESQKLNSLTLRSTEIGLEDTRPLRYVGTDPVLDFNTNFENAEPAPILGAFSDDFNEDFDV